GIRGFHVTGVQTCALPISRGVREDGGFEAFAPTMVAPRILNRAEVERALQRQYPSLLRDAGLGGTVLVMIWLDENGEVVRSRIRSEERRVGNAGRRGSAGA